ncbi:hypothetical protein BJX76DRAFT_352043 [Aspergillus varians]
MSATIWASTLIGPLETTFVPPSTCISDVWQPNSTSPEGTSWLWLNLGPIITSECLPSGWGPSAYYSPARCPSGYSANSVYTVDSETRAVCCPSNGETTYSLRPPSASTNLWYATELCQTQPSSGTTSFPLTVDAGGGLILTTSAAVERHGLINAYGISIRWKESDFPASTSATPTATDTPESSQNEGNGLSGGAKAGIGVGVSVGALLVLGIAVAFFLFRPRKSQQLQPNTRFELDGGGR